KLSSGVTGEFGPPALGDLLIDGIDGLRCPALHRFARALLLFFELGLEASMVEREAALRGDIFDQIVAHSVSVVELEDIRARNDFTGGFFYLLLPHIHSRVYPPAPKPPLPRPPP